MSLVMYCISKKKNDYFSGRALETYAWGYWLMLLRPLALSVLLQLFWSKKIATKMCYTAIITFLALIVSFYSESILEQFVIVTTSIYRDYRQVITPRVIMFF